MVSYNGIHRFSQTPASRNCSCPSSSKLPSYRHHKGSGQAVVTLCGITVYLGGFDSAGSRAKYDRVVAGWIARGRIAPGEPDPAHGMTIVELMAAFLE